MKRRNGEPTLLQWMGFDLIGLLDIAIEAEARATPPALDVERLAEAIRNLRYGGGESLGNAHEEADELATEYARLAARPEEEES